MQLHGNFTLKRIEMFKDPETEVLKAKRGFICHEGYHWFCIRHVSGCWVNLDSTKRKPIRLSEFYLEYLP